MILYFFSLGRDHTTSSAEQGSASQIDNVIGCSLRNVP
jgi:hypothetical protein